MGRSNRHDSAHSRCHAVRDKRAEADPRAARQHDVPSCSDSEQIPHHSHIIEIRLSSSHTLNLADSENPPTRLSSRRVRVPGPLCPTQMEEGAVPGGLIFGPSGERSMSTICKRSRSGNRSSVIWPLEKHERRLSLQVKMERGRTSGWLVPLCFWFRPTTIQLESTRRNVVRADQVYCKHSQPIGDRYQSRVGWYSTDISVDSWTVGR